MATLLLGACVEWVNAVSLGRPRGLATISRPLDMPVAARLDGGEALRPECLSADVFFGERRLGPGDARVTLERAGESPDVVLRIRTRTAVDEPVVTVFLQAGCELASTRRYVFLAEPPAIQETSASPAVVAAPSQALPTVQSPQPAAAAQPRSVATAEVDGKSVDAAPARKASRPRTPPTEGGLVAQTSIVASQARDSKPADVKPSAKVPRNSNGNPPPKSRLKLDAVDLQADKPVGLRSSTALELDVSVESPELEAKRRAARSLWSALNSSPEALVKQGQTIEDLSKRLTQVSSQVAQVEQRATKAEAATEQAKAERFRNPLVYFLAALVAVLGALLAWAVLKGRRAPVWWQPSDASLPFPSTRGEMLNAGTSRVVGETTGSPEAGRQATWRRKLWGRPQPSPLSSDFNEDNAHHSDLRASPPPPAGKSAKPAHSVLPSQLGDPSDGMSVEMVSPSDFDPADAGLNRKKANKSAQSTRESLLDELDNPSGPSGRRSVNVEELLDVHQQVEFFATLGEFEQAAELLQIQLEVAPDSSALLYLDLLDLYRKSGNQEEYEETKQALERRFAVQAPDWGEDSSHGRTLEDYEQALRRITALWPSPKVLTVIEESLLRRPESPQQAFDLPAYRELLMLYSVASSIIENGQDSTDGEAPADAPTGEHALPKLPDAVAGGSLASVGLAEVDLLLDVDEPAVREPKSGFRNTQIEPLQASTGTGSVVNTEPPAHLGLDLDLSLLDGQDADSSRADVVAPPPVVADNLLEFRLDDFPAKAIPTPEEPKGS